MFSMPSQNTRRKVRLNEKVESRVRGNLSARFGGECLETYHCKRWQGAGCLAYGKPNKRVLTDGYFDKSCLKSATKVLPIEMELSQYTT